MKSTVYPWHARYIVTLFCAPRHHWILRSLGGLLRREHLRSYDPGVGHGLNSSKFAKSLPLSALVDASNVAVSSPKEHSFDSVRHNVASLAVNRRREIGFGENEWRSEYSSHTICHLWFISFFRDSSVAVKRFREWKREWKVRRCYSSIPFRIVYIIFLEIFIHEWQRRIN